MLGRSTRGEAAPPSTTERQTAERLRHLRARWVLRGVLAPGSAEESELVVDLDRQGNLQPQGSEVGLLVFGFADPLRLEAVLTHPAEKY